MTNGEGTLDDAYLSWLYSHIGPVEMRNPAHMYWKLGLQLYTTPFRSFVRNDQNRIEDGKELRIQFLDSTGFQFESRLELENFMGLDCSMFELILALSIRASFQTDDPVADWFWRFMKNLELDRYSDDLFEISIAEEVQEVLDNVIWRKYGEDGRGGLFPLRHPEHDQRKIELWYQLSAYILEDLYAVNVL